MDAYRTENQQCNAGEALKIDAGDVHITTSERKDIDQKAPKVLSEGDMDIINGTYIPTVTGSLDQATR